MEETELNCAGENPKMDDWLIGGRIDDWVIR
jgi:hypothetical protein